MKLVLSLTFAANVARASEMVDCTKHVNGEFPYPSASEAARVCKVNTCN